MGYLMKEDVNTMRDVPQECYVLRIDGRVNSMHRSLLDALKAALRIKYQFPLRDIKTGVTRELLRKAVPS